MHIKYIVIAGNLLDGFEVYGPFVNEDRAAAWAKINIHLLHYEVLSLLPPY